MFKYILLGLFTFGLSEKPKQYVKFGSMKKDAVVNHLSTFQVDYSCVGEQHIKIELYVSKKIIWQTRWSCSNEKNSRSIVVPLPKVLAYKPSHLNSVYWLTSKCNFLLCIIHPKVGKCVFSTIRNSKAFKILPPFERQKYYPDFCLSFFQEILFNKPFRPICKIEPGWIIKRIINFIITLIT